MPPTSRPLPPSTHRPQYAALFMKLSCFLKGGRYRHPFGRSRAHSRLLSEGRATTAGDSRGGGAQRRRFRRFVLAANTRHQRSYELHGVLKTQAWSCRNELKIAEDDAGGLEDLTAAAGYVDKDDGKLPRRRRAALPQSCSWCDGVWFTLLHHPCGAARRLAAFSARYTR
ncbi:hypothetical protein BD626DRAFT_519817 [Schizophyllum amplum]|uniref:Uncharacterized protein n=1 Tax=Schizophyllum amplum TaxID=97359 RepID=A0A550BUT0_9AGAR|nr:hypothetical protein BD626DRAFT_519817 [Auriculariopsis ampla]